MVDRIDPIVCRYHAESSESLVYAGRICTTFQQTNSRGFSEAAARSVPSSDGVRDSWVDGQQVVARKGSHQHRSTPDLDLHVIDGQSQ